MGNKHLFFSLSILLSISTVAQAGSQEITQAAQWLRDTKIPASGWTDPGAPAAMRDTAEVVRALENLGLGNDPMLQDAKAWMSVKTPGDLDSLARRVMALGNTAYLDQSDLALLLDLFSNGNPLPFVAGTGGDDFWVDALALRALSRAARGTLLAREDLGWMLARVAYTHRGCVDWIGIPYEMCGQFAGWGLTVEFGRRGFIPPDVVSTALALQALSDPYFENLLLDLPEIRQSGVDMLLSSFHPDGGAGTGLYSSIHETCLAVLALRESGGLTTEVFSGAVAYLLSRQASDGSWEADPYLTALAIQVLWMNKPNLVIGPHLVTIDPTHPVAGDPATISITVKNQGPGIADAFTTAVYNGDPDSGGTLLGTNEVPGLLPTETSSFTVPWTETAPLGQHEIHVLVDTTQVVDESDETDNRCAVAARVLPERDLEVLAEHMHFTPEFPAPENQIRVKAKVSNLGGIDLANITVRFFDGNPTTGGSQVGPDQLIPTLESLAETWVEHELGLLTEGEHEIFTVVDPDNQFSEPDLLNNTAFKAISVKQRTDLVVLRESFELSNNKPYEGDTLLIRARVWNSRELDAYNVTVRLFNGDPGSGGVQLGPDIVFPNIQSLSSVVTEWYSYGTLGKDGTFRLFVQVDPENIIEETSEENNTAYRHVTVHAVPDLAFVDIWSNTATVEEGTPALIWAKMQNIGSWNAHSRIVRWYDGDPSSGGIEFHHRRDGSTLRPGDHQIISGTINTAGRYFEKPIFVQVIPEDPKEISKDNNMISITLPMVSSRPDLEVSAESIVIDPEMPVEGDLVAVKALVRNLRNALCQPNLLDFYKEGDRNDVVATAYVPELGPHESVEVSSTWDTNGLKGDILLGALADSEEEIDEIST